MIRVVRLLVIISVLAEGWLGAAYASTGIEQVIAPFDSSLKFSPPVPLERIAPVYPDRAARHGTSGEVEISFMVGTDGKAYELVVDRSSSPIFEQNSITAIKKYNFDPATLSGRKVDGRLSLSVLYQMEGDYNGVAKQHIKKLKKLNDRLVNLPTEPTELAELESDIFTLTQNRTISPCGRANAYLAMQQLAQRIKNVELEISALQRLQVFDTRYDEDSELNYPERYMCFSEDIDRSIDVRLVILLLTQRNAAAALREVAHYDQPYFQSRKQFLVDHIPSPLLTAALVNQDAKTHALNTNGYTLIEIIGSSINIRARDNNLHSAKLRCDAGFREIALSVENIIEIPPGYGRCQVQVIGEPSTEFDLTEFRK